MKLKIILLFIIAYPICSSGQSGLWRVDDYKIMDTATLKLTYLFKRVSNPKRPDVIKEDRHILLIGSNMSKYYSQWLVEHIQFTDSLARKGWGSVPSDSRSTYNYEFYKNHPEGKITVTDLGHILFRNYIYEDTVIFEWQLHDDFSEILGYKCQKATTFFRGRNYTVWFTMEIPISNGPWKFSGLPGLIVKASDSENHYYFELIGIERTKSETIKYYTAIKYYKITRKDLQKLHERRSKDAAAFNDMNGIMTLDEDGNIIKNEPPRPYNPIERE